jgi:hypothetical protein
VELPLGAIPDPCDEIVDLASNVVGVLNRNFSSDEVRRFVTTPRRRGDEGRFVDHRVDGNALDERRTELVAALERDRAADAAVFRNINLEMTAFDEAWRAVLPVEYQAAEPRVIRAIAEEYRQVALGRDVKPAQRAVDELEFPQIIDVNKFSGIEPAGR